MIHWKELNIESNEVILKESQVLVDRTICNMRLYDNLSLSIVSIGSHNSILNETFMDFEEALRRFDFILTVCKT